MGFYVNLEMPKGCASCPFYDDECFGAYKCDAVQSWGSDTERASGCPLVPVPPHGRLGDLDKLEQMFVDIDNAPYSGFDGTEPFYSAEDAAQIIRLAPTIIPASGKEG